MVKCWYGLTGCFKKLSGLRIFLVLSCVLVFFLIPLSSASFSDDFSTLECSTNWKVANGGCTAISGYITSTQASSNIQHKTHNDSDRYFSFRVTPISSAEADYVDLCIDVGCGAGLRFTVTGSNLVMSDLGASWATGTVNLSTSTVSDVVWEIINSDTQARLRSYNSAGTLVSDETVEYTFDAVENMTLRWNTVGKLGLDNIVSSVEGEYNPYVGTVGSIVLDNNTYSTGDVITASISLTNPDFDANTYWADIAQYDDTGAANVLAQKQLTSASDTLIAFAPNAFGNSLVATLLECPDGNCITTLDTDTATLVFNNAGNTYVAWLQPTYALGSPGLFNYAFSAADSYLGIVAYSHRAILYKDGVEITRWNDIPQSGQEVYQFPSTGTYRVVLQFGLLGVYDDAAEASVLVNNGFSSYLSCPTVADTGETFTCSFNMGESFTNGYISVKKYDSFGVAIQGYNVDISGSSQIDTQTINIGSEGRYQLNLINADSYIKRGTADVEIRSAGTPTYNFTANLFEIDADTYTTTESVGYTYALNNTLWNAYPYRKILIESDDGLPINSVALSTQMGNGHLPLRTGLGVVQTGAAYANLSVCTSVFGMCTVVDSIPITITSGLDGGYSITVSPQTVCQNDAITVKYVTSGAVGNITMTYVNNAGGGSTTSSVAIVTTNGTRKIAVDPSRVKDRSLILFDIRDVTGYSRGQDSVMFYKTGCTPTDSYVAPTGTPDSGLYQNNTADRQTMEPPGGFFRDLRNFVRASVGVGDDDFYLIGIMIIAICTIVMLVASKHTLGGVFGGFLGLGISTTGKFIDPVWAVMIVVIAGLIFASALKKGS